ncbi:hypothetical protein C8A05DRAFT_11509 [Staphylotrichum tortipilum]|uniref:Amidohydrolase 3 domain-containing protein n=1 Tax=Staphylotrichum tortipilum TaxID=2831512 RepID=A0AAN6RYE6_9PEZI|nr:hypothetical protein C8A05DRAFT_11509 [Staphylotrichum longicolle]
MPPASPSSSPSSSSSSSSPTLRWALRASLLAGGVAVGLGLQSLFPSFPRGVFSSSTHTNPAGVGSASREASPNANDGAETYCYQSVRTTALTAPGGGGPNCFSVSPSGTFTRVFSRGVEGGDEEEGGPEIQPGHVLPGLWDGHGHLLQYGEFLHSADLFGAGSVGEVRRRLREYVRGHDGVGSREVWGRGDLLEEDEELKGKYFMLDRVDVHCTWVSRAVLELLGDLPDEVPGGEIIRSPGMGVFCDNAMDLVMALWPRPGKERKREWVASAMRELHSVGLVGMHDAGVLPADLALYDEMSRTEDWTLRVYAMVECPERNTFCPDEAVKIEHPDGMLSVRSVKLFADGALGSWGSAMLEPYADRPDMSGSLLVNASTLTSLARSWSAAGYQVNIHAIGDLANRLAIDALEASLRGLCPEPDADLAACQARHRFRIEHAQIIHLADQRRLHALGIVPSIQPTHATSDMVYAARRLGADRTAAEAYRMRSLLDLAPVLGSDFPVEPPNPFEGLYAAVARKSPRTGTGPPGWEGGWHVEEALGLGDALDGFTRGAARGAFLEGRAGVIQEGAFADWVVLDEEIGTVGTEGLRKVRVRETWVGGRKVYDREVGEGKGKGEEGREDL